MRSVSRLFPLLLVLSSCATGSRRTQNPPAEQLPGQQLVTIAGATFMMGDPDAEKNETPRRTTVATFRMMRFEVTNKQFADFVARTGHVTHPEKKGAGLVWDGTWRTMPGADWRHPLGPDSDIENRDNHPVVQVSARDGAAFCEHHGLRLPSEAEWELAARGTDGRRYPWGNQAPTKTATLRANFGTVACCAADASDGYMTTAPVGQFPAGRSPFGIHDMAGNVWEWTENSNLGNNVVALRGGGWGNNPYCLRTSYRHFNRPDVGRDHIGIRCAADAN